MVDDLNLLLAVLKDLIQAMDRQTEAIHRNTDALIYQDEPDDPLTADDLGIYLDGKPCQ